VGWHDEDLWGRRWKIYGIFSVARREKKLALSNNILNPIAAKPDNPSPRLAQPVRITKQAWPEGAIPVVSICCVAYNHEKFIRDCLDGFLMQETTFPVEILIHDDASTDGTKEIIEEYCKKHPKLFFPIFQKENQFSKGVRGMMLRFNFPRCRGKYIALCEGDDYWTDPHKLQKQADFLERNLDYIACFHNAWIDNSIENTKYIYHHWKESRAVSPKEIIEIGGYVFPTAALMFRSLAKINLPENCIAGDLSLSLDLLLQGQFYFSNEFMCVYRRHEDGIYSGIIKDYKKMQNLELSVIALMENRRHQFPSNYDEYFKTAIKAKYNNLFYKLHFPIFGVIKATKYYSLMGLLRLLIYRIFHE